MRTGGKSACLRQIRPIQNVASLPLNTLYNSGAAEKVIFSGRVQQNGGKMGRKWVNFPAEWSPGACSQSLLSPPALVTGLRVKTIERCKSGFE